MSELTFFAQRLAALRIRPRTWVVTGVAGFVGSNLLEALLRLDQRVVGLDNFATGYRRNLDEVCSLVAKDQWARFEFVEGDICDLDVCKRICKSADYVSHQAALGSVPRSLADPIATNAANVTGFVNMLVAARDARVARFVYASSSAIYGDHPDLPKVEGVIGRPISPYAVTKLVDEIYAGAFARAYGMEAIGLRYFNVFGPRQDPNSAYSAVIPKWMMSMTTNKSVYIDGDGTTSRDFCYIDNVVQANILAATTRNCDAVNQVYNISLGDRITLNDLYIEMRRIIRDKYSSIDCNEAIYRDFREGDVRHSQADIAKARRLLGYAPAYRFKEGLRKTIQSYMEQKLAYAQDRII